MRTLLVTVACIVAIACAPPGPPKTTSLRLTGSPASALVSVDEQMVGTLAEVTARGVALPPGRHFVTVKAPGYFPFDKIVIVEDEGGKLSLETMLVPLPQ